MQLGRSLWSRDETILALGLAVDLRDDVDERHQSIRELSHFLRDAVPDGAFAVPRLRNPYGVACKVRRLAALARGQTLRGAAAMEATIWLEFAGRPDALAIAVGNARARIADLRAPLAPSRGPEPAFGTTISVRDDGITFVYLAKLAGALLADGRILAKVGRSADVGRRMCELNFGFPRALGLSWRPVAVWRFRNADAAHAAEQGILARSARAGWSAGGEFLALDEPALDAIALDGPVFIAPCLWTRSPRAQGRVRRRGRARP